MNKKMMVMDGWTELLPTGGVSGKSFYGKAWVWDNHARAILRSYDTKVAMIRADGSFIRLWGGWSATTMRHVNAFRIAYGLAKITKGEWMDMGVANA